MARFRSVCVVLIACTLGLSTAFAQAPAKKAAEKTPGDLKSEAFLKLRDKADAPATPARFAEVMGAGFAFLAEFPADRRTNTVISSLATFGTTIKDKKLAAQRAAWLPQLKFELMRQKEGKSDEVLVAFAALSAAIAGQELREAPSKGAVDAFREKIDQLARMPGSSRFIVDQERSYLQFLRGSNLDAAEKAANAALKHKEKNVVQLARDELNLIKLTRDPIEFTGKAIDGSEVDFAKLRGKVVMVLFWSTTNEASVTELKRLKEIYTTYKKSGFELVAVSQDAETAREAVAKVVKEAKITWPVLFDGQGNKGGLSEMLNARSLPASAIFRQNGKLVVTGARGGAVESEIKKALAVK